MKKRAMFGCQIYTILLNETSPTTIKISVRGYKYLHNYKESSGLTEKAKKRIKQLKKSLKVCYKLNFSPVWNVKSLYKPMSLWLKRFSRTIIDLTIKESIPGENSFPKMDSVQRVVFSKRSDLFFGSLKDVSSMKIVRNALAYQKVKHIEFSLLNDTVIKTISRMPKLENVILNTVPSRLLKFLEKIAVFYVYKRFKLEVKTSETFATPAFIDGF